MCRWHGGKFWKSSPYSKAEFNEDNFFKIFISEIEEKMYNNFIYFIIAEPQEK